MVLEAIKRYQPGMLIGYPGLLLEIANYPNVRSYDVSAIHICISSSAPLSVEAQEAFEKLTRGHLIEKRSVFCGAEKWSDGAKG